MTVFHPVPIGAGFGGIPNVRRPSLAAGKDAKVVLASLAAMERPPPSATVPKSSECLSEPLFNISAQLKVLVSKVSMHLPDDWCRRLFRKIDHLHDPDDWEASDIPVQQDSFMSFLRLILQIGALDRMSLGVSAAGHLLLGWISNQDSLTLEFAGAEEIRWAVVRHIGGQRESAAGRTRRERLPDVLKPYSPENWLYNAIAMPA
jgi:hypothetical protein